MQTSILGIGYAYDSHLSYLDHLRIADSARKGGEVAGEAADRGARRVEAGIAAAASQVTDAVHELSSEVRASNQIMEWGFSAMLNEMAEMRTTLKALLQSVREPSQTWAYEQFEIARDNFRKGNYEDCLKRLDYAIDGYQTYLGYPEEWRLHQLKGDIYLQCPDRSLIDLPKAEKCFLAAAKYADTSQAKAMALTASAVAAYNQGHMELAEKYAQQACETNREMAEAYFQLTRIRLNRHNYGEAWQSVLKAMRLDHRYAARLPLDSEFQRNAELINPAWRQYAEELKARLEAAEQSATATIQEVAKSQEETNRLRNSRAFELLDLAGNGLAVSKVRVQKMTELMNTLSAAAENSLKLVANSLRENTVFAFLEAEPEAKRANDLAIGALAASREAEYTLRKVEQLSQGLPTSFPFFAFLPKELPSALLAGVFGGFVGGIFLWAVVGGVCNAVMSPRKLASPELEKVMGSCFLVSVLIVVGITVWNAFLTAKKKGDNYGISNYNWSAANTPQTTAETDGTIIRANEAMKIGAEPNHLNELEDDWAIRRRNVRMDRLKRNASRIISDED